MSQRVHSWAQPQNYKWQNRKKNKGKSNWTLRLPQVDLRCKDCVSIAFLPTVVMLAGRVWGIEVVGGCARAVLSSFFSAAILLWEKTMQDLYFPILSFIILWAKLTKKDVNCCRFRRKVIANLILAEVEPLIDILSSTVSWRIYLVALAHEKVTSHYVYSMFGKSNYSKLFGKQSNNL